MYMITLEAEELNALRQVLRDWLDVFKDTYAETTVRNLKKEIEAQTNTTGAV
jgi:hypothetical protein